MATRRPEPTKLFRTLPVSANTVRVSYVVDVPSWQGQRRFDPARVFALLHDARRGWGVEDGRFELSAPHAGAPLQVQERMRAARRAYEGLAKHGAIPDDVEGYLVVEHPGRKPDENLAAVVRPAPRSFAEVHEAVRLAHAAKGAMYGIAVDHGSSARVFQGDSAVPHVEEFADGWRVWVPAKHAFVGDRDMQPFRTMADAVDHLDAVKAAQRSGPKMPPAQRALFGKANSRTAARSKGSAMPARRTTKPPATSRPASPAPRVETLFPVLPVVDGAVSITYAVNVPRPQSKGASASRKAFDRVPMFSLIHHPKRGWGIADDSFERSTWVDRGGPARERDFDLAHRAYKALANDWRFPDSMGGVSRRRRPRVRHLHEPLERQHREGQESSHADAEDQRGTRCGQQGSHARGGAVRHGAPLRVVPEDAPCSAVRGWLARVGARNARVRRRQEPTPVHDARGGRACHGVDRGEARRARAVLSLREDEQPEARRSFLDGG